MTNLHSFRGCLYCQSFTNELLTNLQKKKKTKKKSAIQREAHMHTKSFIVVWFCFVTPPGLELQNKGPTSKTSAWSYQKKPCNLYISVNVCKWLIVCDNDLPQQFSYCCKWVK